jgi:cyclopropane fatty-acyl-phospholipid synthase-like methyltransferase
MAWNLLRDRRLRKGVEQTFDADDVARYYDDWNERYEAVFGDVYQHLQATDRTEMFDHMAEVAQLGDGDAVLDAGCGICGPAIEFAGRADVRIDALTVSPQQAVRAREHVAENGLTERIQVHVGDFHHLDQVFGPERFDLVYFLEAMVHAADPVAVLASVRTVLKPGGRLYIKDFYRGIAADAEGQREIDECVAATNEICHLTIRNTADMLRWIAEAGFEVESSGPLAVSGYSIDDGHEFCARYDLDVAAGRDFRTTFYLDNLEIRARRPA